MGYFGDSNFLQRDRLECVEFTVVSATIPVASFPGSHPKREREPGNIGVYIKIISF